MIPIRDTQRSRRRPLVNWLLIVLNFLVFVYEISLTEPALEAFMLRWGVIPRALTRPETLPRAYRAYTAGPLSLVTSMFIHVGWVHVVGNMLYLFIFGDNVEDLLGHGRYLLFYLASGIGAGLAHVLSSPGSRVPTVGASGAVAGVLGAYFLNFPRSRVLAAIPLGLFFPIVEVPAIVFLFLWFLTNLLSGVASLGVPAQGGVAWWAHVGGFLCGMILSLILRRRTVRTA